MSKRDMSELSKLFKQAFEETVEWGMKKYNISRHEATCYALKLSPRRAVFDVLSSKHEVQSDTALECQSQQEPVDGLQPRTLDGQQESTTSSDTTNKGGDGESDIRGAGQGQTGD